MSIIPRFTTTALLGLLLAAGSALAQEKVMREGQVTEKALIEALSPAATSPDAAASAGADSMRTRSFRPSVRPAGAAAGTAAAAAQPGKASILVTFVTDSADLTARAKNALDVLAGAMKSDRQASTRFTIEGHADPRGSDEHNLKLSQARAEAVRAYLLSQHGMAADRVNAVGKGSSALMKPSDPAAPENRRVTIVAQPG
ncbi:MAG: OmpA family protein [Rubrivivax sp.]|nr:OmpA family protein [Rubrivivax sp.]